MTKVQEKIITGLRKCLTLPPDKVETRAVRAAYLKAVDADYGVLTPYIDKLSDDMIDQAIELELLTTRALRYRQRRAA